MQPTAGDIRDIAGDKSRICREILESLPQWFGIPEAIDRYSAAVAEMPMLGALIDDEVVGFVALKFHTAAAVEAYVLGIKPQWHRRGLGRRLFARAEEVAMKSGCRFITVKTIDSPEGDRFYGRTRRFYEAIGFLPIETFPTLWHPANPCLFMLKALHPSENADRESILYAGGSGAIDAGT
jgi:ribosomal protein S18 acetylase RimI-like enzyme